MNQENSIPQGYLIVHATTARGTIPLEGVMISVRNYTEEPDTARGGVVAARVTGRDGNTERIVLPAPPLGESMTAGGPRPYAVYNLEATLEGYRSQSYIALPIFEGITAVQPVDMIPLPENGKGDPYRPTEDRFFETEAPRL